MAKNEKKPAVQNEQVQKAVAAKKANEAAATTEVVPVDRRHQSRERRQTDRRGGVPAPVAVERRKVERREKTQRRRQIDPTTCERDYSAEELEFMNALALYKRTSGRMFPTCSEILEVVRHLGYEKRSNEPVLAEQAVIADAIVIESDGAAASLDNVVF